MGSPRLSTGPRTDVEREMLEKARRREHAQALSITVGRLSRYVGIELRLSMRFIEEMAQGVKRSHAEALEETVEAVRAQGHPEADAIASVACLVRRIGYQIVPLAGAGDGRADVEGAVADAGKEFAEGAGAALAVARSRFRSPSAIAKARREVAEARLALHAVEQELDELDAAAGVAGGGR